MTKRTAGISAAALATAQIEELLQPAIDELRRATNVTERSGVYSDVSHVRTAMANMQRAIDQAQRLARRVGWPLSPADRRTIVQNLSAGIAQRERRDFPPGDQGRSNPHPAPSSAPEAS